MVRQTDFETQEVCSQPDDLAQSITCRFPALDICPILLVYSVTFQLQILAGRTNWNCSSFVKVLQPAQIEAQQKNKSFNGTTPTVCPRVNIHHPQEAAGRPWRLI
jgi:hypothetical protein